MTLYLARQLLSLPATLLGVSILTFLFLRLIPGDAIAVRLGTATVLSPEQLAELRGYLGLDQPLHRQYLGWLGALVQGDAQRLPFADGCFDAAVSGFALRNFASLPVAFAELARVLRPGARFGLLEVDRPDNRLIRSGHSFYFNHVVPVVGGVLSSDMAAYRYLPASAAYLPARDELLAMGAVCDVLCNFLDADGRSVPHALNRRVMSIDLADLARARHLVIASGGAHWARAILAAIRRIGCHTLVTDEGAARAILKMVSSPSKLTPESATAGTKRLEG